ncbi:MAG: NAD(+) synthase [Bacillota bacterium]|jgi:NAD+ synthase
MRFVVSACLLGCNCKYSGGNNLNPRVQEFLRDKEYIPICPEVDGGLPTPRAASEIAGGDGLAVLEGKAKVLTETGMDVTRHFLRGARIAVQAARDFGAGAALLKERSPSCGARSIYSGNFSGTVQAGSGVTGAALAQAGLLLFSEESIPKEGLQVDYAVVTEKIVSWLREKVTAAGAKGCVLGLSGGIDSAVAAALAREAFPDTTLALILPVESSSLDVEDAWLVARTLDLKAVEINLDGAYRSLVQTLAADAGQLAADDLALANIKPRLRMIALYYQAARNNYLVIGTGNKSEIVTGFFTKHGDGAVDLEPLGELVKAQVCQLARHLGIPERIIAKAPSAGLWPGQTDEEELGFSYRQLDEYILSGTTDPEVVFRIREAMRRARHKLEMPPTCPL